MPEKSSQRSPKLKLFSILESLPCINTKLNNFIHNYHCMKHSSLVSGIGFWLIETTLKTWCNLGLILLFCMPMNVLRSQPVMLVDEFICHQLEFIERRLSMKTGTEYKARNESLQRCLKLLSLTFRLLFLWPRIMICLVSATWRVISNEFHEDSRLAIEIFSSKLGQVRRTTTRIPKKRHSTSPCKRKRKHQDALEEEVEQYLFMNESYRSDNDPDYEIGETTCDFEESTGESATDEESVDTKGFLCEKCREDCDDNCEENRKENFKEDAKNTDEESDGALASVDEEECDREGDSADNFDVNSDAVEEITSYISARGEVKALTKEGDEKIEQGSPICKKG